MQPSDLALFWAGVLACAILVYVILDGFDLGVGVLFGTTADQTRRARMMNTIAPFWDGNETWLVLVGAGLFAAFPDAYAVFLGAFYFPVLLLLFGLIFRGIAFEFRYRTERMRHVWDRGFFLGSTVVAFVQGAAVGAMMRGIPVTNGQYAGSAFSWLHPFAILTGIGLVLGYALLGASWLVLKSEGDLHDWASHRLRWLAAGVLTVLFLAFTVTFDYSVLAQQSAGKSLGTCLPRDRSTRPRRDPGESSQAGRQTAVRDDHSLLSCVLPELSSDVLAVHDSLFHYRGKCGGAGRLIALLSLCRSRGPANYRHLHDRRLLGVPREVPRGRILRTVKC